MPTPPQFTLFVGDNAWRLGVLCGGDARVELLEATGDERDSDSAGTRPATVPGPSDADRVADAVDAAADRAVQRLNELGCHAQQVTLAIPSAWCLSASISIEDLDGGGRRQAMAFRFEEHLPISAEDMVADYLEFSDGTALAVGADAAPLRRIIDALEARGAAVGQVCPIPLLVAAAAVEDQADAQLMLINNGAWDADPTTGGYDLIELPKGRPTRWWWFADDDEALRAQLTTLTANQPTPLSVVVIGEPEPPMAVLQSFDALTPTRSRVEPYESAARHAGTLAQAGAEPWITLRRGDLAMPRQFEVYRKAAGALALAAALLLLAIAGIAHQRADQYRAFADDQRRRLVDVFEKTLENQSPPPAGAIRGRLRSERNKLAGMGGRGGGDLQQRLDQPSALEHLASVLRVVNQTNLRCRLLDLSIQPDLVRLDGQARSHVEAERLAVELREVGRFDVDPPKTKALPDRGVSFLFRARPGEADQRQASAGDRP